MERTFSMIKPDAVAAGKSGAILEIIEDRGFRIVGMKKVHMSKQVAEKFYEVHKARPFYKDLTTFMSSGPAIVLVLEKDNAVKAWRELMGATNPADAANGTLRRLYGASIDNNAVHGSDAAETAAAEIKFFFADIDLV